MGVPGGRRWDHPVNASDVAKRKPVLCARSCCASTPLHLCGRPPQANAAIELAGCRARACPQLHRVTMCGDHLAFPSELLMTQPSGGLEPRAWSSRPQRGFESIGARKAMQLEAACWMTGSCARLRWTWPVKPGPSSLPSRGWCWRRLSWGASAGEAHAWLSGWLVAALPIGLCKYRHCLLQQHHVSWYTGWSSSCVCPSPCAAALGHATQCGTHDHHRPKNPPWARTLTVPELRPARTLSELHTSSGVPGPRLPGTDPRRRGAGEHQPALPPTARSAEVLLEA
jgi:hypothetical protein